MTRYYDETVDIRPAPAGWRVAILREAEGELITQPLAGWLIQAEVRRDVDQTVAPEYDKDGGRVPWSRRIVPAWITGDGLDPADAHGLWTVLGPDETAVDADTLAGMRDELTVRPR